MLPVTRALLALGAHVVVANAAASRSPAEGDEALFAEAAALLAEDVEPPPIIDLVEQGAGLPPILLPREPPRSEPRFAPSLLERQPQITFETSPDMPTEEQADARARESTNVAGWSASEASAAAAAARSADAAEAAAAAELAATRDALAARKNVVQSVAAAKSAIEESNAATAATMTSRDLVDKIPKVAMQGAQDAVHQVVAAAVERMEQEAWRTADEAAAAAKAAQLASAKLARDDAQPFIDAKIRAEKNSMDFLYKGRVASESATELMNEALHVAGTAEAYQAANNPVVAQLVLNKAHDLMHKGKQMEAYATAAASRAASIRGMEGGFAKAAKAAAKYGAYQGNAAGKWVDLPPLPAPLSMPPAPAAAT